MLRGVAAAPPRDFGGGAWAPQDSRRPGEGRGFSLNDNSSVLRKDSSDLWTKRAFSTVGALRRSYPREER